MDSDLFQRLLCAKNMDASDAIAHGSADLSFCMVLSGDGGLILVSERIVLVRDGK